MLLLQYRWGVRVARFLDQVNWKHGLKTAIAAGACLALSRIFQLQQGYWASISAIIVMQLETSATLSASWDRLIGTAFGALVGWLTALCWHGHVLIYVIAVLICMIVPQIWGFKNPGRLAAVAATIVLLVPAAAPYWIIALDRFVEVSLGIVVALAVSQTIWRKTTTTAHP